jgi:hypothetical protein
VTLDLNSRLGHRLLESGGKIESGQIANMRTYMLPAWPKTHTRILGESRTLCGRSLRNNGQWAWQFINTGSVQLGHPPSGSRGRDACAQCARSPVLRATFEIADARRSAFRNAQRVHAQILTSLT